tara:strand:- start:39 stop:602 length:564 start_codon:yes stop_codon:yes gene_type:complete
MSFEGSVNNSEYQSEANTDTTINKTAESTPPVEDIEYELPEQTGAAETGIEDDAIIVEGRRSEPIADKENVAVNPISGEACGFKPVAQMGDATISAMGCVDIKEGAAVGGVAAAYAPDGEIVGPVMSAQFRTAAGVNIFGQVEKYAAASVELDTGQKISDNPVHLDVGVQTDFDGGAVPLVGVRMPF